MAFIAEEVSRPPLQQFETRSGLPRSNPFPTQLFCRRMIEQAFHDASLTRNGQPTESALEAHEWLSARTDWTIHGRQAPPPELRREFYGTFDWACRWLGEDPAAVREHGLPPPPALVAVTSRVKGWVQGLSDVERRWTIAASRQ